MRILAAACVFAAIPAVVLAVTASGGVRHASTSSLDRLPKPLQALVQGEVADRDRPCYPTPCPYRPGLTSIDVYGPAPREALAKASVGHSVMVTAKERGRAYLLVEHGHFSWGPIPTGHADWDPPGPNWGTVSTQVWPELSGPTGARSAYYRLHHGVPPAIAKLHKLTTIKVFF